jgi:hypothetical protein
MVGGGERLKAIAMLTSSTLSPALIKFAFFLKYNISITFNNFWVKETVPIIAA